MSSIKLITQILEAIGSHDTTIMTICDADVQTSYVRIAGTGDEMPLPDGKLRLLDRDIFKMLHDGVRSEGRTLHYEEAVQKAVFPDEDEPFKDNGLESAARFAWGHFLLSSSSTTIASYEPRLSEAIRELPEHMKFDMHYPADRTLRWGTCSIEGQQEWMGFGRINSKDVQAAIMGTRAATDDKTFPSNAILGSELAVLAILLSSKTVHEERIAAILSFTNTHARVIQASIVDRKDGPQLFVKIRHNEPLQPEGWKTWARMLRWGFWTCEKDI